MTKTEIGCDVDAQQSPILNWASLSSYAGKEVGPDKDHVKQKLQH